MKNVDDKLEFGAGFAIAGAMFVNNKTKLTYDEIYNFIDDFNAFVNDKGYGCSILFTAQELEKVAYAYSYALYVGDKFVALKNGFDIEYLMQNFLVTTPPVVVDFLCKKKNSQTNNTYFWF